MVWSACHWSILCVPRYASRAFRPALLGVVHRRDIRNQRLSDHVVVRCDLFLDPLSNVDDMSSNKITVGANADVHTNNWIQIMNKWRTQSITLVMSVLAQPIPLSLMTSHPSVEFRALQTKLLSRSRFHDSGHVQACKPLELTTVARVLFTHNNNQSNSNSLLEAVPTKNFRSKLRFTEDQQHGQNKTQHCVHNNKKKCGIWSCVSLVFSTIRNQLHGYGWEHCYMLRSTLVWTSKKQLKDSTSFNCFTDWYTLNYQ